MAQAMSSVDETEIAEFNSRSEKWWGTGAKALHSMNLVRVPLIRDGLINGGAVKEEYMDSLEPLRGLNVLDVGCGGGILSEALAKLGCSIVGLDAAKELIEVAKAHAMQDPTLTNLSYVYSTIEDFAIDNRDKFDVVVSSEVIEHVTEKDVFMEACVKCLKPGGTIFVTTFDRNIKSWLLGIVIAEYVFEAIPKGTHTWDKFITPQELTQMLNQYNCETILVRGFWINVFNNQWYWSSPGSVCYGLQAVKTKL